MNGQINEKPAILPAETVVAGGGFEIIIFTIIFVTHNV
jgi:hypothetical protein